MNREIKFRVWDKKEKRFWYFNLESLWEDGYRKYEYGAEYEDEDYNEKDFFYTYENMPIMQYTGLNDKDDKEVYEGDILLIGEKKRNDLFVVKFITGSWIAVEIHNSWKYGSPSGDYDYQRLIDVKSKKIIGNIYENPELLKS